MSGSEYDEDDLDIAEEEQEEMHGAIKQKPSVNEADQPDRPDEKDLRIAEEQEEMQGAVKHKLTKKKATAGDENKPRSNLVVKLLEKNPLGMTLPEMAGGTRKLKRIRTLRPMLAEAIKQGLIMPVSQRAGHTVYKLVKNIGPR